MRLLIAVLLIVEGVATGVVTANRVTTIAVHPPLTVALILFRALVGAAEFAAGWTVVRRQPAADALGRGALLASAGLRTLELGFGLAPTDIFPTYRWPLVAAYWSYALLAIAFLSRRGGNRVS